MRRFVRTFFVKRRGQVTVLQDGQRRVFEVYFWRAGSGLEEVGSYFYEAGCSAHARSEAVAHAERVAAVERAHADV